MQLAEMMVACQRDSSTRTVCEKLVHRPSQRVLDAQYVPEDAFDEEAIEFMKKFI